MERSQWNEFLTLELALPKLVLRCFTCEVSTSGLRSLCWKFFLGVLEICPEASRAETVSDENGFSERLRSWMDFLNKQRQRYFATKRDLEEKPQGDEEDLVSNNPLSDSTNSPWQEYFTREHLKRNIRQDVTRMDFSSKEMSDVLLSVLLVWSVENPAVSYQQGMHDLLVPFVRTLMEDTTRAASESQSAGPFEGENAELRRLFMELFDRGSVEADSYLVFDKLMNDAGLRAWFPRNQPQAARAEQDLPLFHECHE
eukprot:RCo026961